MSCRPGLDICCRLLSCASETWAGSWAEPTARVPPKKGWHIQSLLTQRLLGIEDFLAHLQIGSVTTPAAQHLHPLFLLDGETAFGLSVPGTEVVAVP